MKGHRALAIAGALLSAASCSKNQTGPTTPAGPDTTMSFFVTSVTSTTGNLGGLRGADATCQRLAAAAGQGGKVWRAYLSVDRDPDNGNAPTHARTRIGNGPWYNAERVIVATNLTELHARTGNAAVFIDESGRRINGQWPNSPGPNQHDILTGSTGEGMLLSGFTCGDWTSDATTAVAQVGHSDGLGPGGDATGALSSWSSSHANQNCANTAPRGGAGRFYCFAR